MKQEQRIDLIKQIIAFHNAFVMIYMSKTFGEVTEHLFKTDLVDLKPDRFYLVESLVIDNPDYDNKTFKPRVEVRYQLRSKEANAYGDKHQAFYDRYLSTVPINHVDLEKGIEAFKDKLNDMVANKVF